MYVSDYKRCFLPVDSKLRDALVSLDDSAVRVCLVVDDDERLVGLATDGDVRRALLDGVSIDAPLSDVANTEFFAVGENHDSRDLRREMRTRTILQVPVLDDEGRVVGLASRFTPMDVRDATVVIMAGGLGSRLRPLTDDTPKPMLPLAGRPIIEHTIRSLRAQGFHNFIISLNYLADKIERHFGDGSWLDVSITYVRETKRLGTAGALSLISEEQASDTLLVLNGDVLTDMPFTDFVASHIENDALATVCVREEGAQIDFGVVQFDEDHTLSSVVEKPIIKHFVNAGIYCLSRRALDIIPDDEMFDMPQLLSAVKEENGVVRVYPCDMFWIDIGRIDDYERAQHLLETTTAVSRQVVPITPLHLRRGASGTAPVEKRAEGSAATMPLRSVSRNV